MMSDPYFAIFLPRYRVGCPPSGKTVIAGSHDEQSRPMLDDNREEAA